MKCVDRRGGGNDSVPENAKGPIESFEKGFRADSQTDDLGTSSISAGVLLAHLFLSRLFETHLAKPWRTYQ
jgi:hypothetical protein